MTNEKLYEILGNIDEKHIIEAKKIQKSNLIISNKWEEKTMKKTTIAIASLTLCVCLTGITVAATTEKGFFKDIKGFNGAVIGTAYEQATEEVEIKIANITDQLTLELNMVDPTVFPYRSFELFGIENYKIVDMNGNVIRKDQRTELTPISNGTATATISLENIPNGKYNLMITQMIGSAKAEQPLILSGIWECEFEIK